MITIAKKVVTGRCDRCGHLVILDLVKDESGRKMLLCRDCISLPGKKGLTDPLRNIRWPECENATMPEH